MYILFDVFIFVFKKIFMNDCLFIYVIDGIFGGVVIVILFEWCLSFFVNKRKLFGYFL